MTAKKETLSENIIKEDDRELWCNTSCWEAELGMVYEDSLEVLLPISQ